MIGLFDRDVLYKLCCCDLWNETLDALGISEPYRLASTSNEKSNRKAISRMLGAGDSAAAIPRLETVIATTPVLPDDLTQDILRLESYQRLSAIDGIDSGEQLLAALLIENREGQILLSGDKRFVAAFQESWPEMWTEISALVVSFEKCLLAVEAKYGFEHMKEKIVAAKQCDGSLRNALGHNPSRDAFCEGLISFDPLR